MFFIGIFGIYPEDRKITDVQVNNYPGYPMGVRGDLYRNNSVFEFFFIPVLRFNKKYYLKFPDSHKIYLLDKDYAEEALKSEKEVNFYDLEEMDVQDNTCPDCGKIVEGNYKYCPYCGKEL
ncbi:MAG: zinc ribbon domain-containing protein [Clostridia bacterium]|jgi:hypothetical protein|nr:zinc ribbon domain-containing protein [Clostridia bacterium]